MKSITFNPKIYLLIICAGLLVACSNDENEDSEDYYFEPVVDEILNIQVDESQTKDFTLVPFESTNLSYEFDDGLHIIIEFQEDALKQLQDFDVNISPIVDIPDIPIGFEFHFGLRFQPEGIQFNKPGKVKVELPTNVSVSKFKGFVFDGGYTGQNNLGEIWNVRMTPVTFESINGNKYAVFDVWHFSGIAGVSGENFECGHPLAAYDCSALKEIIACLIAGKESLSDEDIEEVNNALSLWLKDGIEYFEQNPQEIDEYIEAQWVISEFLCWQGIALKYNSSLQAFGELPERAGSLIGDVLIEELLNYDVECSTIGEPCDQIHNYQTRVEILFTIHELEAAGIITANPQIDINTFCDSAAHKLHYDPILDTTAAYLSYAGPINKYELRWPSDYQSNHSTILRVYAKNLHGQYVELALNEDYTIPETSGRNYSISGNTVNQKQGGSADIWIYLICPKRPIKILVR